MNDQNIRIVIAEDEYLVRVEIKHLLRDSRYTVIGEARNGEEAVKMAAELNPDLILMDIKMPKIDGLEASRQIIEQYPLPIVIISAYESSELIKQASEVGIGAFLSKPPQYAEIDRAITVALAQHDDLMEMRRLNKELKNTLDELEKRVQERTIELEHETKRLAESNIALKVLMDHRKVDQKHFEENILFNVRKLVFPYLGKMSQRPLASRQKQYLNIIEENLKEIVRPFAPKLNEQLSKLTPAELQTADLTKQGKTTKEIADLLALSPTTIATHKQRIRKKLGLTNKKLNLMTILSSTK